MSRPRFPDLRHVGGHDLVAALGHDRRFRARPFRAHADAEKADAERLGDFAQLREMRMHFAAGLVHRFKLRAGQFELAAGLQRNRAAAGHVGKADDVAALHDRLPAEQMAHAFEERADAALALIGNGRVALEREGQLFVLGADAELRRRLHAGRHPGDEFVPRLERCEVDLVASHSCGRSGGQGGVAGRGTIHKPHPSAQSPDPRGPRLHDLADAR
jgi:hypothetical protein